MFDQRKRKRFIFSLLSIFSLLLGLALLNNGTANTLAASEKEMIYIGGYDKLFAVDPETRELVAEIPVEGANRNTTWPADGSKLYVNTESRQSVIVIDTKTNQVVEKISFSTPEYTAYIYGLTVDPKGEVLYATIMRTKLERTEFKVLPTAIKGINLATKEVVKEVEVPWGTHTIQFLESGDKLAVFGHDVYMYDLKTDELSFHYPVMNPKREEDGYGNYLYFWTRELDSQNVSMAIVGKYYPLTDEESEGVIMLDLKTGEVKEVTFEEPLGFFSASLSPDRKWIYGGMNYLAKVDAETGEYLKIVPNVPGTSYGFNISRDGKTIYVSGAGADLSFYNAETLEHEKTIPLSTDTMDVRVVVIKE